MTHIATFLEKLPATWKALTALAGAAALGFSVAILFGGWTDLPEQVGRNTTAIEANTQAIRAHDDLPYHDGVEHVVCLVRLTLTDSTYTAFEVSERCPR